MKKIIILLLITTCFTPLFAFEKEDNSVQKNFSYDELIITHANNDTCKALIEIFFEKRRNTAIAKMSFLPISAATTAIVPPVGLALMAASTPFFLSGLITNSRYSRKKLNRVLNNYKNFSSLSKRHKKLVVKLFNSSENKRKKKEMITKINKMRSIALK